MLYLPPPEKSLDALRLLGVELRNNHQPENWGQYENLLRSRLNRLAKDPGEVAGLVNCLVSGCLLEYEDLERSLENGDLDLVELLLESNQFHGNLLASRARRYLNNKDPKNRNRLLKEAQKDPEYQKLNAAQKLQELRSVNLWEWWDCL